MDKTKSHTVANKRKPMISLRKENKQTNKQASKQTNKLPRQYWFVKMFKMFIILSNQYWRNILFL